MKTTLFFYFLFFGIIGYSQVKTKVIVVDLGTPHKETIRICEDISCTTPDKCKSKWLSIKAREMVSIKLTNINSVRYTYKIDTKNISFYDKENQANEVFTGALKEANKLSEKNITQMALNPLSIADISGNNKSLNADISNLNNNVDLLYTTLKQKTALEEKDYFNERILLLDEAKRIYAENDALVKDLERFIGKPKYSAVKTELDQTKKEIEKTMKEITQKFYTIELVVYTLPVDVQGKNIDALEFRLHRTDKETKEEDLSFASTPYNIWIKGGFKIDVSAGIFATSLFDDEFDKRDDPAIAGNKIITLKNGGDYDLALGSTINAYVRLNSWVVPTINLGAVFTQNEKIQILFGGGVILGKQERIILTGGVSMGKVNRIADSYNVGGSYNLGDSGDVPTQNQFKFGHFFGITYNLSKVKKISLDKGIEQN